MDTKANQTIHIIRKGIENETKQNIEPQYKICAIRASQKMQAWPPSQKDPQKAMT